MWRISVWKLIPHRTSILEKLSRIRILKLNRGGEVSPSITLKWKFVAVLAEPFNQTFPISTQNSTIPWITGKAPFVKSAVRPSEKPFLLIRGGVDVFVLIRQKHIDPCAFLSQLADDGIALRISGGKVREIRPAPIRLCR